MIIQTFGLFWERAEVDWFPGKGGSFRLLGHIGRNLPGLRLADFRDQIGIYVLYNDYGPYNVGLTIDQGLGVRLRQHCGDRHAESWRRFSWFGFRGTEAPSSKELLCSLKAYRRNARVDSDTVIGDLEAMLIKTLGPRGQNDMNFHDAEKWDQVRQDEIDSLEGKVAQSKNLSS